MNKLFDALEVCLQEIEAGAEIESVLARYPDLADELRPILEASLEAKKISAPKPSEEIVHKNRAKILQRAAEMRETRVRVPMRFNWMAGFQRVASVLTILALFLAAGTSLVSASSMSVPGDQLYRVKRSWENMQLFFTFNEQTREALEMEHENERLEELRELFASGRTAEIEFSSVLTRQTSTGWLIAGIPVDITPETILPGVTLEPGLPVRVIGTTQPDGSVLAGSISLLPPGARLPDTEDDNAGDSESPNENESNTNSGNEAPEITSTPEPEDVTFDGTLNVLDDEFWTINGVNADISNAEVEGTPAIGAAVIVEGYFNEDGVFIVTKIKFVEDDSNSGSGSNSNDNDNGNDNNNSNDNNNDNGNDNDNDNDNDNSNDNDNDNSGSGGGGDD